MQPVLTGGHPRATPQRAGSLPEPQQDVGGSQIPRWGSFHPKKLPGFALALPKRAFHSPARSSWCNLSARPGAGWRRSPVGIWWPLACRARRALGHQALPTRFSLPEEIATARRKLPHFKDQQHLGKFWLLEAEGSVKGVIKLKKSERKRAVFDPTIKIYH